MCIADLNVCKGEAEFTQDWCQLPHDNRNSGFFRLEHSTTCSMHEETVINGSNHMLVIRGQSSPLPTIERNQSAPGIRLFSIINGATLGLIQVRLLGGTLVYDSGMESHQKTFGGLIKLEMNRALPASSTCYIARGILSNGTATEGGAIYAAVSDSAYWRDSTMMNLLPKACKVILRDTNVTDNKAIFYRTNSYGSFGGRGGAIYLGSGASLQAYRSNFVSNRIVSTCSANACMNGQTGESAGAAIHVSSWLRSWLGDHPQSDYDYFPIANIVLLSECIFTLNNAYRGVIFLSYVMRGLFESHNSQYFQNLMENTFNQDPSTAIVFLHDRDSNVYEVGQEFYKNIGKKHIIFSGQNNRFVDNRLYNAYNGGKITSVNSIMTDFYTETDHEDLRANARSMFRICPPGTVLDKGSLELGNKAPIPQFIGCPSLCNAGKYANTTALRFECADSCYPGAFCPPGTGTPIRCPGGRYSTEYGQMTVRSCQTCPPGMYSDDSTANIKCKSCPAGYHQPERDRSFCASCKVGQFASENGTKTEECSPCPRGWYQGMEAKPACQRVEGDFVVLEGEGKGSGGISVSSVPDGWYKTGCDGNGTGCTSSLPCPAGTKSTSPISDTCDVCPPGEDSAEGSNLCTPCAKGTYKSYHPDSKSICVLCPANWFQEQQAKPSERCKECPSGWAQDLKGESFCSSKGWKFAIDCKSNEYLNDSAPDRADWNCVSCVRGGACRGPIAWSNMSSLFGWARCPGQKNVFERCPFGAACLGEANPRLEGKYVDVRPGSGITFDPARCDEDESDGVSPRNASCSERCNDAYLNSSLLCGSCAKGYSRVGTTSRCDSCPAEATNVSLAVAGICFGVVALFVLIALSLKDDANDLSERILTILTDFLQLTFLLSSFPVEWPDFFVTYFQLGGAVTVLGQHLVNEACLSPHLAAAEVLYSSSLFWAMLPIELVFIICIVWIIIGKKYSKDWNETRSKIGISIVTSLNIIWPSLCNQTMRMFACRTVCSEPHLMADANELCWSGRHLVQVLVLGMPMAVLYVIGWQLLSFLAVRRLQRKAKSLGIANSFDQNQELAEGHFIFGSLYKGQFG